MNTRLGAALACAFVGVTLGAVEPAAADYRIRVDNKANPGAFPNWAAPNNKVRIEVHMKTNDTQRQYVPNAATISDVHDAKFLNDVWTNIQSVCILADTTDTFGIDQLEITDGGGAVKRTFGVDNNVAWCVSTDPNDGNKPDCKDGLAQQTVCFYL